MKRGNLILIGISGILVIGAIVGCIVVGVTKNHKSSGGDKDVLSTSSRAIAAICAPTDYKQACVDSLSSVSHNESATLQQHIQAALQYTIDEIMHVRGNSSKVKDEAKDPLNKMAADDCQELLQYAVHGLRDTLRMVRDPNLYTREDRDVVLTNWIIGVLVVQETCPDGFNSTELSSLMSGKLTRSYQLTENALAIFIAFNDIMKAFNIPLNIKNPNPSARRLLEADGYPTWMSAEDRKLLQRNIMRPNAVVAKDGSGQFKSIGEALAAYPKNLRGRYVIYVKAGVYDEHLIVEENQVNVYMYGDGPKRTVITGKRNYRAGVTTIKTATFSVQGMGFAAKGIRFENTAGPEGDQAVALRLSADMVSLYDCKMVGFQDTLYLHANRHFIRNCVISGTVDFIFGEGNTVIQDSKIVVRLPMKGQENIVTANGRTHPQNKTALVIQNCKIVPESRLFPVRFDVKTYLGRPWRAYSRTVIRESKLGDFIHPAGWRPWDEKTAHWVNTLEFVEFNNSGPGASTTRRVKWKGFHDIKNRYEVAKFTAGGLIGGKTWIPETGFPFYPDTKP